MSIRFGISAALTTPFTASLAVDVPRLLDHAARVLEKGCDGVTFFGTTGEGPSLSQAEKAATLNSALIGGLDPACITLGVGAPALDDAVAQALVGLRGGVRQFLVMPPYYFKGVSQDGLFEWYAGFLERIVALDARVIFYHIPQVTGVALTPELLMRLRAQFGPMAAGIKDSSGDWEGTRAFLDMKDMMVLVGDERHLGRAAALGAAGAISGMANLFPEVLARVLETGRANPGLDALVDALVAHPVTPAVKALVGVLHDGGAGADIWARVRPPLEPTPAAVTRALADLARAVR